MHLLVTTLLEEARRRGAVLDAIEHHDLVDELDLVACGFATLPADEALEIVDPAIALSDTCIVRAICPAAVAWFNREPKVWWESDEQRLNAAICWAHCNGRDRQTLATVSGDKRQAWRVISAWVDSLDVPLDKVAVAIATMARAKAGSIELLAAGLKALRRPDAPNVDPAGVGHLYATLMREYSHPLEYFLFDVSEAQLDIMIESLGRRNLDESYGAIGADGTVETAAARRRRANWTAAKMEFLRRVRPKEATFAPAGAIRTDVDQERTHAAILTDPSTDSQNKTGSSATERESVPATTTLSVDASSQGNNTSS